MISVQDVRSFSRPPGRFRALVIKHQSWLLNRSKKVILCTWLSNHREEGYKRFSKKKSFDFCFIFSSEIKIVDSRHKNLTQKLKSELKSQWKGTSVVSGSKMPNMCCALPALVKHYFYLLQVPVPNSRTITVARGSEVPLNPKTKTPVYSSVHQCSKGRTPWPISRTAGVWANHRRVCLKHSRAGGKAVKLNTSNRFLPSQVTQTSPHQTSPNHHRAGSGKQCGVWKWSLFYFDSLQGQIEQ